MDTNGGDVWSGADTHRGDAIDLVVAVVGFHLADAIAWLARPGRAPIGHFRAATPRRPPTRNARRPRPFARWYAKRCAHPLWAAAGGPVRRWLHSVDSTTRLHAAG